jgi:formylglycine-generating enzyme required for sulfatase activity
MLTEAIPNMMTPIPSRATDGMAQVASGTLGMGSDAHYSEERPAHNTMVDRFWIDTQAVTNAAFAAFAAAVGAAERSARQVRVLPWDGLAASGTIGR